MATLNMPMNLLNAAFPNKLRSTTKNKSFNEQLHFQNFFNETDEKNYLITHFRQRALAPQTSLNSNYRF